MKPALTVLEERGVEEGAEAAVRVPTWAVMEVMVGMNNQGILRQAHTPLSIAHSHTSRPGANQ